METIKDYAISLSLDTSILQSQLGISEKKTKEIFLNIGKNIDSILMRDLKKAAVELNTQLSNNQNKVKKTYEDTVNNIVKLETEKLKKVKKNSEEEFKIKADTLKKITDEEKKAVSEVQNLQSQKSKGGEKSFFKQDVSALVPNIDSVRQMQSALLSNDRTFNLQMKASTQKLMTDNLKSVKEGYSEVNNSLTKAYNEGKLNQKDYLNALLANQKTYNKELERLKQAEERLASLPEGEKEKERTRRGFEGVRAEGKQLGQSERALRDAQRDQSKTLGKFKVSAIEIEKEGPIDQMRELGVILTSNQKDLNERLKKQIRDLSSNEIAIIDQAEKNIQKILIESHNKQIGEAHKFYKREMQALHGNEEEQLKATERFNKQLEQLEKEHQGRLDATKRTGEKRKETAPMEQKIGRMGARGEIFSFGKDQLGNLGSGLGIIGDILPKLGPVAGGIAAVGGALVGVVKGALEAREAFMKFNDETIRISTLLNDTQMGQLPDAMNNLRGTAVETGADLNELQKSMYGVLSSVPALANNLEAAASAVELSSKTATALGASTDEVSSAMGNFGNAAGLPLDNLENQKFIMDALVLTMNQGVIPSGSVLASNIAKAAPAFATLSSNAEDTIKVLGSMTSILTQNGISTDEAQTNMKALANELLNTKTRTELVKSGLQGIDKETGKVKDWSKLFQSLGQDTGKFVGILGSQEAQNAVRILGKDGGKQFTEMMNQFDNMAGTADGMYEKMSQSSEVANKKLSAAWNDMMISIGQSVESATGGIVGSIMNMTAGVLTSISDWFKPAEQKLKDVTAKAESANDSAAVLASTLEKALSPTLDEKSADKVIERVKNQLGELKETSPGIADEVERVLNTDGTSTVDKVAELIPLLKDAKMGFEAIATDEAFKAQELALESFNDKIKESRGFWARLGDMFAVETTFEGVTKDLDEAKSKAAELKAEINQLPEGDKRRLELYKELAEVNKEVNSLSASKTTIEKATNELVEKTVKLQIEANKGSGEAVDREALRVQLLEEIAHQQGMYFEQVEASTEFNDLINKQLDEQLGKVNQITQAQSDRGKKKDVEVETKIAFKEIKKEKDTGKQTEILSTLIAENGIQGDIIEKEAEKAGLMKEYLKLAIDKLGVDIQIAQVAGDTVKVESLSKLQEELKVKSDTLAKEEAAKALAEAKKPFLIEEATLNDAINQKIEQKMGTQAKTNKGRLEGLSIVKAENEAQLKILEANEQRTPQEEAMLDNLRAMNKSIDDQAEGLNKQLFAEKNLGVMGKDRLVDQGKLQNAITEKLKQTAGWETLSLDKKIKALEVMKRQTEQQITQLKSQGELNEKDQRKLDILTQSLTVINNQISSLVDESAINEAIGVQEENKLDAIKKQHDLRSAMLDLGAQELELAKLTGEITEETYGAGMLENMKQRVQMEKALLAEMQANGAPEADIIAQKQKVVGAEIGFAKEEKSQREAVYKKELEQIDKQTEERRKKAEKSQKQMQEQIDLWDEEKTAREETIERERSLANKLKEIADETNNFISTQLRNAKDSLNEVIKGLRTVSIKEELINAMSKINEAFKRDSKEMGKSLELRKSEYDVRRSAIEKEQKLLTEKIELMREQAIAQRTEIAEELQTLRNKRNRLYEAGTERPHGMTESQAQDEIKQRREITNRIALLEEEDTKIATDFRNAVEKMKKSHEKNVDDLIGFRKENEQMQISLTQKTAVVDFGKIIETVKTAVSIITPQIDTIGKMFENAFSQASTEQFENAMGKANEAIRVLNDDLRESNFSIETFKAKLEEAKKLSDTPLGFTEEQKAENKKAADETIKGLEEVISLMDRLSKGTGKYNQIKELNRDLIELQLSYKSLSDISSGIDELAKKQKGADIREYNEKTTRFSGGDRAEKTLERINGLNVLMGREAKRGRKNELEYIRFLQKSADILFARRNILQEEQKILKEQGGKNVERLNAISEELSLIQERADFIKSESRNDFENRKKSLGYQEAILKDLNLNIDITNKAVELEKQKYELTKLTAELNAKVNSEKDDGLETIRKEIELEKIKVEEMEKSYKVAMELSTLTPEDKAEWEKKRIDQQKALIELQLKEKSIIDEKIKSLSSIKYESFDDIAKNLSKDIKNIAEAFNKGGESIQDGIIGISNIAISATKMTVKSVEQIVSIGRSFREGDSKAGVMGTGELLQSVGQAFVSSGIPGLTIAGGILLLGGMITSLVGEFMDKTLSYEEQTRVNTERRRDKEDEIVGIYNAQLQYIQEMVDSGNALWDTAEERAEAERQAYEWMVSQNAEMQKMKGLSDEQIANEKLKAQARKETLEREIAELKRSQNLSRDEMGKALYEAGFTYEGSVWAGRLKSDVEQDVKNAIANLEDQLQQVESTIKAGESTQEFRKRQSEQAKVLYDEIQSNIDLRRAELEYYYNTNQIDESRYTKDLTGLLAIQVEEAKKYLQTLQDQGESVQMIAEAQRAVWDAETELYELRNKEMETLKILNDRERERLNYLYETNQIREQEYNSGNLALLNLELTQAKQYLQTLISQNAKLEDRTKAEKNIWNIEQSIFDLRNKEMTSLDRRSEYEKRRLNFLLQTKKITEDQRDKELLAILQEELTRQANYVSLLESQWAKEEDILAAKENQFNIEMEIYNLTHKQNQLEDEKLKKVKELNRERNNLILQSKRGGGALDKAKVAELESNIIAELRKGGATEEQINRQLETFRESLPQYEEGGRTGMGGMIMTHPNEFILNKEATTKLDSLIPGFLESVNKSGANFKLIDYFNPVPALVSSVNQGYAFRDLSNPSGSNSAMITVGGITVNLINGGSMDPKMVGMEVKRVLQKELMGNGVNLGMIN